MASLMIPGSKLTDIWGRKRCFVIGLAIYGVGALLALLAPSPRGADRRLLAARGRRLGADDPADLHPGDRRLPRHQVAGEVLRHRQRRRRPRRRGRPADRRPDHERDQLAGLLSACRSWWSLWIIVLARKITDPARTGRRPRFDLTGAILSALGCSSWCSGSCISRTYGFGGVAQGLHHRRHRHHPEGLHLAGLDLGGHRRAVPALVRPAHQVRREEGPGRADPLRMFRNQVANLGMGTQLIQWLVLQGSFFVVSVFLQQVRHYDAIQTGLMLTPATIGVLRDVGRGRPARPAAYSAVADHRRLRDHAAGMALLLALVRKDSGDLELSCRACCCLARASASCSPRRSTSCSPASVTPTRATSRACPGASRTSARRSARRLSARSWWPHPAGQPFAVARDAAGVRADRPRPGGADPRQPW